MDIYTSCMCYILCWICSQDYLPVLCTTSLLTQPVFQLKLMSKFSFLYFFLSFLKHIKKNTGVFFFLQRTILVLDNKSFNNQEPLTCFKILSCGNGYLHFWHVLHIMLDLLTRLFAGSLHHFSVHNLYFY